MRIFVAVGRTIRTSLMTDALIHWRLQPRRNANATPAHMVGPMRNQSVGALLGQWLGAKRTQVSGMITQSSKPTRNIPCLGEGPGMTTSTYDAYIN